MRNQGDVVDQLDELAGPHEQWCQDRTHGDCCQGECDCGRDERREAIAAALAEERKKAFNEGALAGMKLTAEHRVPEYTADDSDLLVDGNDQ